MHLPGEGHLGRVWHSRSRWSWADRGEWRGRSWVARRRWRWGRQWCRRACRGRGQHWRSRSKFGSNALPCSLRAGTCARASPRWPTDDWSGTAARQTPACSTAAEKERAAISAATTSAAMARLRSLPSLHTREALRYWRTRSRSLPSDRDCCKGQPLPLLIAHSRRLLMMKVVVVVLSRGTPPRKGRVQRQRLGSPRRSAEDHFSTSICRSLLV